MKNVKIATNVQRREREFLGQQMDRARSGMSHALTGIGRSAPKVADPRRWFARHPALGPVLLLITVAAAGTAVGYAINRRRQQGPSHREHGVLYALFAGASQLVSGGTRLLRSSVGRGVISVTIADLLRRREHDGPDEEDRRRPVSYAENI